MTTLPTSQGWDWARILAGIGGGLQQAGMPNGNFSAGIQQGAGFYDQGQDRKRQQERDKLTDELRQLQIDQARTANSDAAVQKQKQQDLLAKIGGGMQMPNNGRPGGMPVGPMDPRYNADQMAFFEAYPEQIDDVLGAQLFPVADEIDAPKTTGGMYWDQDQKAFLPIPGYAEQQSQIAASSRQPVQGPDTWERYVDPETGRAGQRNTKTGKIDWDPGNTMLTQVGTDANGNPVFDLVSGSPGPTKEFEVKAANQSLLLGQGIDELERLVSEGNVSPYAVAGSEQAGQMAGPIGDVAGQALLSADDKQYLAARASALESLANTITGAAFTEQQKINFQNMLPKPTDDKITAQGKINRMRAYLKELETNAKVSDRRNKDDGAFPGAPAIGVVEDGMTYQGGDPSKPESWK